MPEDESGCKLVRNELPQGSACVTPLPGSSLLSCDQKLSEHLTGHSAVGFLPGSRISWSFSPRKTLRSVSTGCVTWDKSLSFLKPASLSWKMRAILWQIIRKIRNVLGIKSLAQCPLPSIMSHLPPHSVAILLYLTHKCKVPDFWYPQDLQARACVDEYLAWQHTTLRRSCLRALWHKVSLEGWEGQ